VIGNRPLRRSIAVVLIVAGALLMWLAPPVWVGAIAMAFGILLEAIGIAMERGDVA